MIEDYVSELKKDLPDIEKRLNTGAGTDILEELENEKECEIPSEFIELYKKMNGERSSEYTGFIAGFEFLPLERVIPEIRLFKSLEYEMMEMVQIKYIWRTSMFKNDWNEF